MSNQKKSVICHLFYPSVSEDLVKKLELLDNEENFFFFNIHFNNLRNSKLLDTVKRLRNVHIITAPEKGRDIGAKFFLIDLMIQLEILSEYTLIIHDKQSPHIDNGDRWRNELFKIIDPRYQDRIFRTFDGDKSVGIIASSKFIDNEFNGIDNSFSCSSAPQIKELLKRYSIETKDYNFVAGNIFWIRTDLIKAFFSRRSISQMRSEMETGNVLDFNKGSFIHAWERIMSWIATSQGCKIYGI